MNHSLISDPWLFAVLIIFGVLFIISAVRWALFKKHGESGPRRLLGDHTPPAWHHPGTNVSLEARHQGFRGMQTACLVLIVIGFGLIAYQEYQFKAGARSSSIPDIELLILLFVILFQFVVTSRTVSYTHLTLPTIYSV